MTSTGGIGHQQPVHNSGDNHRTSPRQSFGVLPSPNGDEKYFAVEDAIAFLLLDRVMLKLAGYRRVDAFKMATTDFRLARCARDHQWRRADSIRALATFIVHHQCEIPIAQLVRISGLREWLISENCERFRGMYREPINVLRNWLGGYFVALVEVRPQLSQVFLLLDRAMIRLAQCQRLDPLAVVTTDFTVQRPRNPAWLAASQVRQTAMYVLQMDLGILGPAIAEAAGCSKQNVGEARLRCEEREDEDAGYAALIRDLKPLMMSYHDELARR